MNLDELQSIRDRERQSDSLQQLRESFYADAGEFVESLRQKRQAAAEHADDPFDAPEVNRLTDDIKTAEQTVEAIYERRVGKLVKMASFAAADMPTEDEGLTAEERNLFEQLVASIEQNRAAVFDILDGKDVDVGEAPDPTSGQATSSSSTPDTADAAAPEGVDAADLMGGTDGESESSPAADPTPPADADGDSPDHERVPPSPEPPGADEDTPDASGTSPDGSGKPDVISPDDSGESTPSNAGVGDSPPQTEPTEPDVLSADSGEGSATAAGGAGTGNAGGSTDGVARKTVRITQDVGEILGVDEREYDLSRDDVVTLPATNVDPLIQRDAAEPLD